MDVLELFTFIAAAVIDCRYRGRYIEQVLVHCELYSQKGSAHIRKLSYTDTPARRKMHKEPQSWRTYFTEAVYTISEKGRKKDLF